VVSPAGRWKTVESIRGASACFSNKHGLLSLPSLATYTIEMTKFRRYHGLRVEIWQRRDGQWACRDRYSAQRVARRAASRTSLNTHTLLQRAQMQVKLTRWGLVRPTSLELDITAVFISRRPANRCRNSPLHVSMQWRRARMAVVVWGKPAGINVHVIVAAVPSAAPGSCRPRDGALTVAGSLNHR
jgi:hypothetical protein